MMTNYENNKRWRKKYPEKYAEQQKRRYARNKKRYHLWRVQRRKALKALGNASGK